MFTICCCRCTLAQHPSHPPPPPSLQYLSRVTRGGGLQPIKTTAKKHTLTLNLYMNVSFFKLMFVRSTVQCGSTVWQNRAFSLHGENDFLMCAVCTDNGFMWGLGGTNNLLFRKASISWIISDETESKIYSTVPYGYFYILGQIPFMILFCMNSIAYFHKTMLLEWTFLGP